MSGEITNIEFLSDDATDVRISVSIEDGFYTTTVDTAEIAVYYGLDDVTVANTGNIDVSNFSGSSSWDIATDSETGDFTTEIGINEWLYDDGTVRNGLSFILRAPNGTIFDNRSYERGDRVMEQTFTQDESEQFEGIDFDTLPSVDEDFSCKSSTAPVNPETVVDIKQDDKWIRMPVTSVEVWINKDGPADMTRTAKVVFPFEWGGESIIKYINGFQSQNNISDQEDPYDECRIFFWDEDIEEWIPGHYGYVGGVGPSSDNDGVGKFWVYDPADLMKGIQVSENWANPSVMNVIDFALNGTDNNGNKVGLENRSVFSDVRVQVLGPDGFGAANQKQSIDEVNVEDFEPTLSDEQFLISLPLIGKVNIPLVSDTLELIGDVLDESGITGQKRFQINRHNMVDHMEWITSLLDARWWFEPSENGPVLVIDATAYKPGPGKNSYERRYFVDESAIEQFEELKQEAIEERKRDEFEDFRSTRVAAGDRGATSFEKWEEGIDTSELLPPHNYEVFSEVDTLNNEALVDVKPFNTHTVFGESSTFRERYTNNNVAGNVDLIEDAQASTEFDSVTDFQQAASAGGYTSEYPFVEVTYEPLIQRAGGYNYGTKPTESDKIYLDEAKNQALKEFRKHLSEETEGTMEIRGDPHIMPYDYIYTIPTCNDTYINADAEPITWEVNSVKHVRKAGEFYTTQLGVSLSIEDSQINVEAKYREA